MNQEKYIEQLENNIERLKNSLSKMGEYEDFKTLYANVMVFFMMQPDEQFYKKLNEAFEYIKRYPFGPPVRSKHARAARNLLKDIEKTIKNKLSGDNDEKQRKNNKIH